jgi:hypothetical protein
MFDHTEAAAFALAQENAVKSLRAIFLLSGRSPDQALRSAVAVIVTLLDHGGPGWLERLIEGQASAGVRLAAMHAAQDLQARALPERVQAEMLLACLARQAMATEVFDKVAELH